MSTALTEPEPQTVRRMPATPEWLRAQPSAKDRVKPIGVDRDNNIIRGMVLAQEGPFKSVGRGEFEKKDLREIVRLAKAEPKGLKSRLAHPNESDDGVGKHLGRIKKVRMETMDKDGTEISIVRGDLHLADSSFDTPSGDIGNYVLNRVAEDSDAISSSLVLQVDAEIRRDKKGERLLDEDTGDPLPPLWHPTELHASDIVWEGDAVDGLLGSELSCAELPNGFTWQAGEMLSKLFTGQPREVVEARCAAYLKKYLDRQFGEKATNAWVDNDEQLHQCREAIRDLSRSDDGSESVTIETALIEELVNKLGSVLVGPAELRAKCEQLEGDLAAAYELMEDAVSVSPVEQGPETPEPPSSPDTPIARSLRQHKRREEMER